MCLWSVQFLNLYSNTWNCRKTFISRINRIVKRRKLKRTSHLKWPPLHLSDNWTTWLAAIIWSTPADEAACSSLLVWIKNWVEHAEWFCTFHLLSVYFVSIIVYVLEEVKICYTWLGQQLHGNVHSGDLGPFI